jgi:hypothetical protein
VRAKGIISHANKKLSSGGGGISSAIWDNPNISTNNSHSVPRKETKTPIQFINV